MEPGHSVSTSSVQRSVSVDAWDASASAVELGAYSRSHVSVLLHFASLMPSGICDPRPQNEERQSLVVKRGAFKDHLWDIQEHVQIPVQQRLSTS